MPVLYYTCTRHSVLKDGYSTQSVVSASVGDYTKKFPGEVTTFNEETVTVKCMAYFSSTNFKWLN